MNAGQRRVNSRIPRSHLVVLDDLHGGRQRRRGLLVLLVLATALHPGRRLGQDGAVFAEDPLSQKQHFDQLLLLLWRVRSHVCVCVQLLQHGHVHGGNINDIKYMLLYTNTT